LLLAPPSLTPLLPTTDAAAKTDVSPGRAASPKTLPVSSSRSHYFLAPLTPTPTPTRDCALRCETDTVAFDEQLVLRVRDRLRATDGVVELKMFGGWGVTVNGNMALGVMERDLIVRVGPETFDEALTRPGVRPFDFTGRSMTGWVFVAGDAVVHGRSLSAWVARGVDYAQSLPPKAAKRSKSSPSRRQPRVLKRGSR
jgi:TfoX/Sxy family transcriptional regulator of competence genes